MFFIGQFSFDEWGPENQPRHGYFTCLVEAENADSAARLFKKHISALKETAAIFKHIHAVYMEDIFEISKVPQKPLLLRFQSSEGQFPKSVTRSFPLVEPSGVNVYGWRPEVERDTAASHVHYREAEPFIAF